MILTLDVGNTQITMGLYDGGTLMFVSRLATSPVHTCDQYAVEIKNILALYGFAPENIKGAAVSSVVPSAGHNISNAIRFLCGVTPVVIGPGVNTGLSIKIDNPAQLGADLIVGAVAAAVKYPLPAIIFDFGTATKISVLGPDGAFLGCAITAGINISIEALFQHTASLPPIVAEKPKHIIGTNTVDSMRSGLFFGNIALIDGMVERIEEELGQKATVIVTGGLSSHLRGQTKREAIFDESLLLEGLRRVYKMNQGV